MSFPARKIRTARDATRTTLQPSVRDFSDQVIGYYPEDDGLYLGIMSRTNNISNGVANLSPQQNTPIFAGSTVTYSTLEAAAQSHLPATFETPRSSMISPDEVHRRHVARSARLRSRLSGNRQLQRTGLLSDSHSWAYNGGSPTYTGPLVSPRPSSGHIKRPWSERPTQFIGQQSPRQRPATTGRYFISGNGLRTSRSARPLSSHTPSTVQGSLTKSNLQHRAHPTSAWVGTAGLHINKMTLCYKGKG